ncbi:MAG: ion transporter [Flavobacteriales bacterium]|nr:ion transporter [Flavobacteriales bacterium]
MVKILRNIADSKLFNNFIVGVILFAGILVGVETYKNFALEHHGILHALDQIVLWIFVAEVIIKIGAEGSKPWNYFKDGWNVFDFLIVAVCFLPIEAKSFIAVLRLARILRVLKLVTALPKLQMIVGALLKSIPSMGYVFLLLFIHFYIFAAMATFIYGENDPIHFYDLQTSFLSLFRAVTLEDWTDLMYINMYGSDAYGYDAQMDANLAAKGITRVSAASPLGAAIFFVIFILTGAMVVLNLFIGVIMTGMDEMKAEQEIEEKARIAEKENLSLHDEMANLNDQLQIMSESLNVIRHRLKSLDEKNSSAET